jgi:hypothetical protein
MLLDKCCRRALALAPLLFLLPLLGVAQAPECSGTVQYTVTLGGGSWADERGYKIVAPNGTVVYQTGEQGGPTSQGGTGCVVSANAAATALVSHSSLERQLVCARDRRNRCDVHFVELHRRLLPASRRWYGAVELQHARLCKLRVYEPRFVQLQSGCPVRRWILPHHGLHDHHRVQLQLLRYGGRNV